MFEIKLPSARANPRVAAAFPVPGGGFADAGVRDLSGLGCCGGLCGNGKPWPWLFVAHKRREAHTEPALPGSWPQIQRPLRSLCP
jgi:hypothetical protein